LVEVGGDREPAGAQADGTRLIDGCEHGADFRERALTSYDDESFPRFHSLEESYGIALDVLYADGAHVLIVAGEPGRTTYCASANRDRDLGFLRDQTIAAPYA
jgi:hypothetical protein